MERRLGRGLGSLLSKPSVPATSNAEIAVHLIRANALQPRKVFDAQGLEELRCSIEKHGVLQPIAVRSVEADSEGTIYELIAGERRLRASRALGKTAIPAVVRSEVRDEDMLELAMVENLQRRDLDPIERALGFRQMQESLALTQEDVAKRVGLKRSSVANHLRLLDLSDSVQAALALGQLAMGHARALLGVSDKAEQKVLMEIVLMDDLSVRATEKLVREQGQSRVAIPRAPKAEALPWVKDVEGRLRSSLGTKVKLKNGENYRGQIVVEYYDQAGLDNLLNQLAPKNTI